MSTREYIGARYVPIFGRRDEDTIAWDNTAAYEPLTVVLYQGNSYTSRQYVPAGIDIGNEEYWAETGNYNAQVEQYRQLVSQYVDDVEELSDDIDEIKNKTIRVVNNFNELLSTTEDVVLVLRNDSLTGDGSSCYFERLEDEEATIWELGSHERTDGSRVVAIPNQSEIPFNSVPEMSLPNVAHSYIGSNIPYGNGNGMFNPTVQNMIDCSTFVCACVQGISYEQSRYVSGSAGENVLSPYGMGNKFPINGIYSNFKGALPTYWLAEWYAEHKRLFKFDDNPVNFANVSKLQTGDILFSGAADGDYEQHLYGINHCMLVMQTFPDDGTVLIAQAGEAPGEVFSFAPDNNVKLTLIDLENNSGSDKVFKYWARPNYYYTNEMPTNIGSLFHTYGEVVVNGRQGQRVNLASLRTIKPLEKNKFYTLILEGDLPSWANNNGYILASAGNNTSNIRTMRITLNQNKAFIIFDCMGDLAENSDDTRILIDVYVSPNALNTDSYEVTKATVIEGIVTNGELCEEIPVEYNTTIFSNPNNYIRGYKDGYGKVHIIGECYTSELSEGNYTLFEIPDYYTYVPWKQFVMGVAYLGSHAITNIWQADDLTFTIRIPSGETDPTIRFHLEI